MITFVVITIIVLAISAVVSYTLKVSRKPKPQVASVAVKKNFHVIVNYVTSFTKTYGKGDYLFLNISIDNKSGEDMEDVVIETIPSQPIITDLRFTAISEKWDVDSQDPVFSDSLISRVMCIEPGTMVSGYIVIATRNAQVNIEGISIASKGEIKEIPLRKERIMYKSNSLRKF